MKKREEIISLNSINSSFDEGMSWNERSEKLVENELNNLKGGSGVCVAMVICPKECRECSFCQWDGCAYDDGGWICPADGMDDCMIMT
ncbi:hypothetical protein [Phocaeicola sp.]